MGLKEAEGGVNPHGNPVIKSDQNGIESHTQKKGKWIVYFDKIRPKWD